MQFGNMQKMDGPTEVCEDSTSTLPDNCTDIFVRIFLLFHFSFKLIHILLQLQLGQQEMLLGDSNLKELIGLY